jgi:hypothetical protein
VNEIGSHDCPETITTPPPFESDGNGCGAYVGGGTVSTGSVSTGSVSGAMLVVGGAAGAGFVGRAGADRMPFRDEWFFVAVGVFVGIRAAPDFACPG